MHLIHEPLHVWDLSLPRISLPTDRLSLARRRWRGAAEDGTEFGFDLEQPLSDGDVVFVAGSAVYAIAQQPEDVLEVSLGMESPEAARIGWLIGNLHFQLEIEDRVVRVIDDPAIRQLFAREAIQFTSCRRIFRPVTGGHHH